MPASLLALLAASYVTPEGSPRGLPATSHPAGGPSDHGLDESLRVRAISIDHQRRFSGEPFPFVLTPDDASAAPLTLREFTRENRDLILRLAADYGAVLFRGFADVTTPLDFSEFVLSLNLQPFDMGCSAAPRTNVAPGVFTANEAPPSEKIPFHHEMAQCERKPKYVIFFCETAAPRGGATPILPSHAVASYLRQKHPAFAAKLASLGIRYVRILPAEEDVTSAIGKSWRASFNARTHAEAERAMRAAGTTWQWLENDALRTETKAMPALVMDSTGRETFFNSMIAAFQGWSDSRNDPKKAVVFGDGTPFGDEELAALEDLGDFMKRSSVAFQWKAGDVLLLHNDLAMHSRETFVPPRRVLASLWGPPAAPVAASARKGGRWRVRGGFNVRTLMSKARALRLRGGSAAKAFELSGGGKSMPSVGLGMWQVPKDACAATVISAIEQGYRHFDCACDYGNEAEVGQGIREAIRRGLVTRAELWITSKLWNTYHAKEHVEPACRRSLSDFGLDYFDLYLVHFPISLRFVPFETRYPPEWVYDPSEPGGGKMELDLVPMHETWPAMEELVEKGLVKNIGVCNFNTAILRDLLSYARIKPAVLQVELHPYNQQPKLVRFCAEHGIVVTGYSPLGAGSYVSLGMAKGADSPLNNPVVKQIAAKHRKSAAQVILRWGLQRGYSLVPKSSKVERLQENIQLGFELDDEDMDLIAGLDRCQRFNDPGVFSVGMGCFCPIYD